MMKSLIAFNEANSAPTEAYRMFRTNLNYSEIMHEHVCLLFTSGVPMEGKSTSVINIAVTYAQSGKRVLIVDGDLRKSKIHDLLHLKKIPGITNHLYDKIPIETVVQKVQEIDNLFVLTSGIVPPNVPDFLNSEKFSEMITGLKELFDVILIDSPPVLSVTDASILAKYANAVVIVVASGITKKESLQRTKRTLEQTGVKIAGVLLTQVKSRKKDYYSYYEKTNRKKWYSVFKVFE